METPEKKELREARLKAGLTQTQAAAVIDCKLRSWQNWESEKMQVTIPPALWRLFRLSTETNGLEVLGLKPTAP